MFAEKKLLMIVCWFNKWNLAPISDSVGAGEEIGPLSKEQERKGVTLLWLLMSLILVGHWTGSAVCVGQQFGLPARLCKTP